MITDVRFNAEAELQTALVQPLLLSWWKGMLS